MKKFYVIGNPIAHSLSPKLHNHWFKINNINAVYGKKKLNEEGIKNIIAEIREGKIDGLNVTTPFKKTIIQEQPRKTPPSGQIFRKKPPLCRIVEL